MAKRLGASRRSGASLVRRVKRKAPSTSFLSMMTNPSGSVGGVLQSVVPGVGAYTGGILVSKVPALIAAKRAGRLWNFLRRHGAPLSSLSFLLVLYAVSKRNKYLRDHQMALMVGAGLAAVHRMIQTWFPGIGKIFGIATPQLSSPEDDEGTPRRRAYSEPHASDGFYDAIENEAEMFRGGNEGVDAIDILASRNGNEPTELDTVDSRADEIDADEFADLHPDWQTS